MDDKDNKIQEILERLVRMETKLDDFTSLREKAEDAYTASKQNIKDISEIKESLKKVTYGCAAMAVAIIGFFLKITLFK